MDENEITLSILQLKEVSTIIEKLNKLARLNMTEGELRKMLLDANIRTYKIVRDYGVIGVLKYDKNNPSEMNIWINDDQAEKVIVQSVKLAIDHIFKDDLKTKIRWQVMEQSTNKDLVKAAKECGFEEEGRALGESSSGDAILKLAILKKNIEKQAPNAITGNNITKTSIDDSKKIQQTVQELKSDLAKTAKGLETEKELNKKLQTALDDAEKNIRVLEGQIVNLKKDVEKEKLSISNDSSNAIGELKQKNIELEALLIQIKNENTKLAESIASKERQIINQIAMIEELQSGSGHDERETETEPQAAETSGITEKKEKDKIAPSAFSESYYAVTYIGPGDPFWKTIKPETPLKQKIADAAIPMAIGLLKMKKDISISELSSKTKVRKENIGELMELIEKKLAVSKELSINIINADSFEKCRLQRK